MICPPSTVANRRSRETRIAVTLGTASLSNAGIGPLGVLAPASGLSAGMAEVCSAGVRGSGTETAGRGAAAVAGGALRASDGAGRLGRGSVISGSIGVRGTVLVAVTGGFDSGFFVGTLTAGGFDSGLFAGTLTAPFDSGFFAGSVRAGALVPLPSL